MTVTNTFFAVGDHKHKWDLDAAQRKMEKNQGYYFY